MHRLGFEPTTSRAKVGDANHYTMKAGLCCSILAFIDMMLVKFNQPYLDLSDKNAFAESDPGHINKVNAGILRYYQHLLRYPTTPCPKSSIDCTEPFFLCFLYDR